MKQQNVSGFDEFVNVLNSLRRYIAIIFNDEFDVASAKNIKRVDVVKLNLHTNAEVAVSSKVA